PLHRVHRGVGGGRYPPHRTRRQSRLGGTPRPGRTGTVSHDPDHLPGGGIQQGTEYHYHAVRHPVDRGGDGMGIVRYDGGHHAGIRYDPWYGPHADYGYRRGWSGYR